MAEISTRMNHLESDEIRLQEEYVSTPEAIFRWLPTTFGEAGVPPADQWAVVIEIAIDGPRSTTRLAQDLGISLSRALAVTKRARDAGWLEASKDLNDMRKTTISLTTKAKQKIRQIHRRYEVDS